MDLAFCGLQESPRVTLLTTVERRSSGLQRNPEVENNQKTWENAPKMFLPAKCRRMFRESSAVSYTSEQNCDMVTGANPNPHLVPEYLTGRSMQSREPLKRQGSVNDESQDNVPPVR